VTPERIVLDTSAYSWLRTGHPETLRIVANARIILVPTIVLGELSAAFRIGRRERDNVQALGRFLARPDVEVVDANADVANEYGRVFAALRRAGTPIPTNDIWIAATTVHARGHLLTFDRNFDRVGGLEATRLEIPR